jgi:RIO kinase 1
MVKLWAEKEVRNLKRLSLVNAIKCPVPHIFKNNVILMDFIGENGNAAPRLKDASVENWQDAYEQTLLAIRRMFQQAKLVHADLSEYNLLWYNNFIYVIDVSQAVELDHPMALDFLRRDCSIMNDFFSKKNLRVLTI